MFEFCPSNELLVVPLGYYHFDISFTSNASIVSMFNFYGIFPANNIDIITSYSREHNVITWCSRKYDQI